MKSTHASLGRPALLAAGGMLAVAALVAMAPMAAAGATGATPANLVVHTLGAPTDGASTTVAPAGGSLVAASPQIGAVVATSTDIGVATNLGTTKGVGATASPGPLASALILHRHGHRRDPRPRLRPLPATPPPPRPRGRLPWCQRGRDGRLRGPARQCGDRGPRTGLGLFGVLSIIRLRSDELAQHEVAYYFSALALGLLGGVSVSPLWLGAMLMAAVLLALWVGDNPRLLLAQPPPADGARPRLRPGAGDDRPPRGAARRHRAGRDRAEGRPRQRLHLGRGALPASPRARIPCSTTSAVPPTAHTAPRPSVGDGHRRRGRAERPRARWGRLMTTLATRPWSTCRPWTPCPRSAWTSSSSAARCRPGSTASTSSTRPLAAALVAARTGRHARPRHRRGTDLRLHLGLPRHRRPLGYHLAAHRRRRRFKVRSRSYDDSGLAFLEVKTRDGARTVKTRLEGRHAQR